MAALRGQSAMVDLLLDAGANIDAKTQDGGTPLQSAAWGGHVETVKILLESGASLPGAGEKALRTAARRGHVEVLRALLAAGVSADAVEDGQSMLFSAIQLDRVDIAEALLEAGADPNGRPGRRNPLAAAIMRDATALVRRLLAAGAEVDPEEGEAPACAAASKGNLALLRELYTRGATLERADLHGWTALLEAASAGRGAVVQWLIEQGVTLTCVDADGHNARTVAARAGHDDVVALLERNGVEAQPQFNEEVARARERASALRAKLVAAQERFGDARPGVVISGAFANFKGRARPADDGQLEVLVEIFGRATAVRIPASAFRFNDDS